MQNKLDESLITSNVCIRCGHCCKVSFDGKASKPNGMEWLNVLVPQTERIRIVDIGYNDKIRVEFGCPKLHTNELGHKVCTIYKDRPKVCVDYNCFKWANQAKRRPQGWDKIKRIIKQVHDVDVQWDGPMYTVENLK